MRLPFAALLLVCNIAFGTSPPSAAAIRWQPALSGAVFEQAAREHRYVLLDLHAVWCHWCHVMDATTYVDPAVTALLNEHYVAVGVDADADPALAARYGDWGWPATIVLAPDGSEIVKRRGYIAPADMASLLQAIVDDPSPGPSVRAPSVRDATVARASAVAALPDALAQKLAARLDEAYDDTHGGWGSGQKFIDGAALRALLDDAGRGNARARTRAQQTLDANLLLIDPVWGGVYQYSDEPDWRSPHFEKIMPYQADDLRLYAQAYTLWQEPRYLEAAQNIRGYLTNFLTSAEGAFYVSQDADLDSGTDGHAFYALDDAARRAKGVPRVDTHRYSRENGWAIAALCAYADATKDRAALKDVLRAARWVLAHRSLPGGGFSHDARDAGGPYLADTLAMGEGFLALYRSTHDRAWLQRANSGLVFINKNFRDADGGFFSAPSHPDARGVLGQRVRVTDENVGVTRLAIALWRENRSATARETATRGMRYLTGTVAESPNAFLPGVLLANREYAELAASK